MYYDNSVHAKILIVDYSAAIISSMNLYAHSSGGGTWEAGMGTTDPEIIDKIKTSLSESFDIERAQTNQKSIADFHNEEANQRCVDCGKPIQTNPRKPRCYTCWKKMVRRKY